MSISEMRIMVEIETLNESVQLHKSNYDELSKFFENYNRTTRENIKNITIETKRLIHNYLSSAVSLIDHTRGCIKNLHQENDPSEYQTRMIGSFDNKLCAFVKELRHYMQHYKLPLISYQKNAFSIRQHASLVISKDELLKFSGWKKNAKSYINEYLGNIDLRVILKEYQLIVDEFYTWLNDWHISVFKVEFEIIEEFKKCQRENLFDEVKLNIQYLKYRNYSELEVDLKKVIPLKMLALSDLDVKVKNEEIIRLIDIGNGYRFFLEKIMSE